jgi:FAD synthase
VSSGALGELRRVSRPHFVRSHHVLQLVVADLTHVATSLSSAPQFFQRLILAGLNSDAKVCVTGFRVGNRSRGRFATPADFPLQDSTLYRGLHV